MATSEIELELDAEEEEQGVSLPRRTPSRSILPQPQYGERRSTRRHNNQLSEERIYDLFQEEEGEQLSRLPAPCPSFQRPTRASWQARSRIAIEEPREEESLSSQESGQVEEARASSAMISQPATGGSHEGGDGEDQHWGLVEVLPSFPHDHVIATTITSRMKCPITLHVMAEPVNLLPSCDHMFGYKEIESHVRAHHNCPMCREPVHVSQVKRHAGMQALIREVVRCRCVVDGCEEEISVDALEAHVKHQCPHARFRCLERGEDGKRCGQVVKRGRRAHHEESECVNRPRECRCGERYRPSQQADHRRVCGEEQVRCPICPELMKRRLLESEHNKDPEVMARHVQALLEENERLRSENETLRSSRRP